MNKQGKSTEAVNNCALAERVKEILRDHFGKYEITEDANLVRDLGADSLDLAEIFNDLEKEFGCEISDEDAESIGTVGDIISFLSRN